MNFDDVDYGVDYSGLEKIKDDIKMHLVTEAQEKLNDCTDVINAISDAWRGDDSSKFCDNFMNSIGEVCDALESYNTQIEKKLDDIYDMWKRFQQSNVQN